MDTDDPVMKAMAEMASESEQASTAATAPVESAPSASPVAVVPERRPAAANEPDLVAKDLVKIYGDRTVVNGMSMDVRCGEIVGLLGPNGAGKTTTFYMIVGLVRPNQGTVAFRGKDLTDLPVFLRAREGLGYLSQEASIFRKLSVWDNVMAILETLKMSRAARKERCEELLSSLELTENGCGVMLRSLAANSLAGIEKLPDDTIVCIRNKSSFANARESESHRRSEEAMREILSYTVK